MHQEQQQEEDEVAPNDPHVLRWGVNYVFRRLAFNPATRGFYIHRPIDGPLGAATLPLLRPTHNRFLHQVLPVDAANEAAVLALNRDWATSGSLGALHSWITQMTVVVAALRRPNPPTLAGLAAFCRLPLRVPTELPVTGLAGIPRPPGPALVCLYPGCGLQYRPGAESAIYRHVLSVHYAPALRAEEAVLPLTRCFPHPNLYVLVYPDFLVQYPRAFDTGFDE